MKRILCLIIFAAVSLTAFCDEYTIYRPLGDGWRIYNSRTERCIGSSYNDVNNLGVYGGRHYFAFQEGTLWGIWSVANDLIRNDVPPKYDYIFDTFYHGYFVFKWKNDRGVSNINDEVAINPHFKYFWFRDDGISYEDWKDNRFFATWDELKSMAKSNKEQAERIRQQQAAAAYERSQRELTEMCRISFNKYLETASCNDDSSLQKWLEKSEFEKSDAYFARTCGAGLVKKYDELFHAAQSGFIAEHERLLRNDPSCRLKLGQYSADSETFELSGRYLAPFNMKVGIDKAPKFKENFESLEIKVLSLGIANDKICCKSITLVDSTSGDSYSFQSADTKIKPKHYILDFSKFDLPYHNGRTGSYGKYPHMVTIQEPTDATLCGQLQVNGYATVKGIIKYGGMNTTLAMRYHIWINGRKTPIEVRVNKRKYGESFSFMISPKFGNNYIISIEDPDGNVSFPIVIDLNGIQYDM